MFDFRTCLRVGEWRICTGKGEAGWEQSVLAEDPFPGPKGLEWEDILIMRQCVILKCPQCPSKLSLSTRDSLFCLSFCLHDVGHVLVRAGEMQSSEYCLMKQFFQVRGFKVLWEGNA